MTLTRGGGPLSARDIEPSNYRIEGPKHRIYWHPFPRRVRAELAGSTVFDTSDGRLLHESEMLPVLYVPASDVDKSLLEQSETTTHCPFKGDASYRTIRVDDSESVDAAWLYPKPIEGAEWLDGHYAFYWERLDAWFDEDERVYAHLRDPFHRVDVRPSSRGVRVTVGGELVAESARPWVLSETGLPNRYYVPAEDVRDDLLEASETGTHCPYKGQASYWSHPDSGSEDIAFAYLEPFDNAIRVGGCISFLGDGVEVEVAG